MEKKALVGIMLTLLLTSMLILTSNIHSIKSEPRTITVPDEYAKIQWAIGNASAGDTIYVRAGIYDESVLVDRTLALIGEDKYTTFIDGMGNVVTITANNTVINGFTIRSALSYGIVCKYISGCNVTNNFVEASWGIVLFGSSNAYVSGNGVSGNGISSSSRGISLSGGRNNAISGNDVSSPGEGIFISNVSNNNTVTGNKVRARFNGVVLGGSDYNTVSNNNASQNRVGIKLGNAEYNLVSGNVVLNNTQRGIEIDGGVNNNILSGNNISLNPYGIYLYYTDVPPSNNKIFHNNFINNTVQAYVSGTCIGAWNDVYPTGGNYWRDYTGIDVKNGPSQNLPGSDGIGDTAYVVNANNKDNYPFMNPWSSQAHDIEIVNVTPSKTIAGQGYTLPINVTVTNQGSYPQTLNVTAYANTTFIASQIVSLESGDYTTITFTWNTVGLAKGDYPISAVADTVPGEVDTADNTYTDGTVAVVTPGDVNADGIVDILDAAGISAHWYPGPPVGPLDYGSNFDINSDGAVDIQDAAIISAYWTGPPKGPLDP